MARRGRIVLAGEAFSVRKMIFGLIGDVDVRGGPVAELRPLQACVRMNQCSMARDLAPLSGGRSD